MDIGSAFTFVFDDEDWIKKVAIGGVAMLLGIIIVPYLLILGYMVETIKNVRDGRPTPLPEWDDFGGLIMKGVMVFVISLVYYIPALIFYCASFGSQLALQNADSDLGGALAVVVGCLTCLQILLSLLAGVIFPAGVIRYARYDTLGSAFQFGEIFSFIRNNLGDYIIAILLSWVAGLVAVFGLILCLIGVFFTSFWAILVSANLYGQLARRAEGSV